MAVLAPGRVSIGFPEPVGSILAEYEPEPTHLDPIHCPNRPFPSFFGSYFLHKFPLGPNFVFDLSRQRCIFWIFWPIPREAPSKVSMFAFRERSRGSMRGQLCSNKFQNLVRRVVFWSESGKAFIFWKYKKLYGIFQVLCSWCHARRGLLGAGNLTFSIFQALCPVVVPAGAFGELENWLFGVFKSFVLGVVPTGDFWELENWLFGVFKSWGELWHPQ